jgi:hypothetical protein
MLATIAVSVPKGQQVYEREVSARAQGALDALGADVDVARSVTRSLRSPLVGTARLPHLVLPEAPAGVRRAVGAVMYPGADVVHSMGLWPTVHLGRERRRARRRMARRPGRARVNPTMVDTTYVEALARGELVRHAPRPAASDGAAPGVSNQLVPGGREAA